MTRRTLRTRATAPCLLPLLVVLGCSSGSSDPGAVDDAGGDDSTTGGDTARGDTTGGPDGSGGDTTLSDVPGADTNGDTAFDAPGTDTAVGPWSVPTAHPRIYLNPTQKARLTALVTSGNAAATSFMSLATSAYEYHAWYSALKFQLSGTASHCTYAINDVDTYVTSEEAKIAAGTVADVAGDSYLYVGDQIGDLALTLDWCWDTVTAAQRTRWLAYANQAVFNVWHPTTAQWGGKTFTWSGWSIDNPVNNYYYSFLRATMLLGLVEYHEDPKGPGWITMFRDTKLQAQLVPAFAKDLLGGGSREGTGYGVSMRDLFRLYDLWEQTTTQRVADLTPHARESLAFMLHQIVPTYDRIAPIGDHARDSTAALFDYHRDYANVLEWLYPKEPLAARLAYVFDASSVTTMSQGFMRYSDFIYTNPALTKAAPTDVYPMYYAPGTGNVFMRSAWAKDATWAHFMCGPYTESHAHQDQGSFMIYKNTWLAYDQNINSHSGLSATVRAHNLVRFDQGTATVGQVESAPSTDKLLALQDEADWAYFAGDLTPVYAGKAAVAMLQREIVWLKPDVFVVFDRAKSSGSGVTRIWQLNTPVAPVISGRVATITSGSSTLKINAILPTTSTLRNISWPAEDSDMSAGTRFESADSATDTSLFLNVLSLGGAATSVVADDVSGQHGVKITFSAGGSATVRFNDATPGATVDWKRADGTSITTGARTMAIEVLPLMK